MQTNPKHFTGFCDRLLEDGKFEHVSFSSIRLDRVFQRVLDRGSVVASLRGEPLTFSDADHGSAILDCVQNPMSGYRPKGADHILIVSGIFTYHRLLQQNTTSRPIDAVVVFMLDKPPKPDIRELLVLHELTRALLRQCFTHSTSTIADFIYAWFDCSHDGSLFALEKWQILFPQLTTKSEFCRWLNLSSKTFIPSGGHRNEPV